MFYFELTVGPIFMPIISIKLTLRKLTIFLTHFLTYVSLVAFISFIGVITNKEIVN